MSEPYYEKMPLSEFMNQPYVMQVYGKTYPFFEDMIKDSPFIQIGKRVRGGFAVFHVDSRRILELVELIGTTYYEMYPDPLTLLGRPSLEASTILQVHRQQGLELRGNGVLIGIIDTGIDYTKEVFQNEDMTSKIRYIWDQTVDCTNDGKGPADFGFGVEYTNEQINQALLAENPYDVVSSTDTVGHGTFLASVAAGRDTGEHIGAAPDADLLVVKLRRMQEPLTNIMLIPPSVEDVYSSADVMLAIDYMLDRAYELNMPLSICIGLGGSLGGIDGFEILEQYMDVVSKYNGICICTAVGNEGNVGHHASGIVPYTNATYTTSLRVPENANSFILHTYVNSPDRMSVSLKSPLGEIVPRAIAISGQRVHTRMVLERTRIEIVYFFPLTPSGDQLIHIKFINPTPGIWEITLYGDIILYGRFNAWLPTTGLITPGIHFLTPDPYTTVLIPGTSLGSITVGAYNDIDNGLYVSSSWGPTRRLLQKPDLVAPGVDVTGVFPMGSGRMTGTSVAAAITAGACALMLQWGVVDRNDISLDTTRIKALLIRGCRRERGRQYPSSQWGYGMLDLFNSFRNLRGVI
jgi:subtilisin family serine protease